MPLEKVPANAASGDPGNTSHKIEAPAPVPTDALFTQLSPEKIKALRALGAGQSVRGAAKSSGVCRNTVHNWLKHDPHFRAAFNAWKEELLESGRARLLKGADAAITSVLKAAAQGDMQAALAILKGLGMLTPQRPGLTDPAMVNREMELDRRQQRIDLAARSSDVAQDERRHLFSLVYDAEDKESRQLREEMKPAQEKLEEEKAKH